VEGLAYEEIAAAVDCPVGTVKSRLFNARMTLRQKLGPYIDGSLES
jgi:RNA polymerase sigma-70 factor (ECF subfamily)